MKNKKVIGILFTLIMIIGMLAVTSSAQTSTTEKNITIGTSALKGGQQSNVYFGRYQQSSLGNTEPTEGTEGVDWIKSTTAVNNSQGPYYKKDPIKWRVLSNADGKAFLLSDKNLDIVRYHEEEESVTWETSTIRSWLNGYDATSNQNSVDYSNDNFINAAFGAAEKGVIADTTVVNDDNSSYNTEGGNNTTDKVFLLSLAEVRNTSYFADNNSRKAVNTAYVYGGGKNGTSGMYEVGKADYWWLRSPGTDAMCAAHVTYNGDVGGGGDIVDFTYNAVRPAFNLNLSSVLFTSAASGGKQTDSIGLKAVEAYTGNEYKLTVKDESRSFAVSDTAAKTVEAGDTLSLEYTGATTGENEYISAMIVDASGEVIYYGQLAQPTAENGTAEFTVPSDIVGTYTLKLFNEQINGDYKTDFSSAFVDIQITVINLAFMNLTFNTNGGTINSGNLEYYKVGETTALPTDVTKDGYVFGGWYENAEFTGDKATEVPTTATGNKEYFAKWLVKRTTSTYINILEGGQKSYIYFGTYQQSSLGNTQPTDGTEGVDWIKSTTAIHNDQGPYYSKDPVKWRVLSNADGKAFLLSDKNLNVVRYHEDYESVTWETSTIRSWLNGYGAASNKNKVNYSNDNFINVAFGAAEKGIIADTTVVNDDNPEWDYGEGGNNTTDKVFLLSIAEVQNTAYGFINDDTRKSINTAYVCGGGKLITTTADYEDNYWWEYISGVGKAEYWWLRSPGNGTENAAVVVDEGWVMTMGNEVSSDSLTVRPAFNLNLSSVLFTSAARGGKPEAFGEVTVYSGNEYKLTLSDSTRSFALSDTSEKNAEKGDTLTLAYTGAITGENEYISAMIVDAYNEVLYYGPLAQATSESGTVELTVPMNIEAGTYTLRVFNEQINGDYKTDYSSSYSNISLQVHTHSYSNGFCDSCGAFEEANQNSDGYYEIENAGQLLWFSQFVNSGNFTAKAVLVDNIDMNGISWTPIGTETPYTGTFNGGGYAINNLWQNAGGADSARDGLIVILGSGGKVHDLTVDSAIVWGASYYGTNGTGVIAIRNAGTISNCVIKNSSVQQGAYEYLGGIAGVNEESGVIENCAVINSSFTRRWGGVDSGSMGGIVQTNNGTVKNCYTYDCRFNNGRSEKGAVVSIGNAPENCYYYTTSDVAATYAEAKTAEAFASGEVAYLLGEAFGQTVGKDAYPVLGGEKVLLTDGIYHNEIKDFAIILTGKADTKATATVTLLTAGTYTLVFADYEGGRLNGIDFVSVTAESDNTVVNVPSEIDITLGTGDKIMLFGDMTTFAPLCEEYVVE